MTRKSAAFSSLTCYFQGMRLFALLLTLAMAFVMAQVSLAQDVPTDPNADIDAADLDEAARLLFESASRAYEAGNFADALARYTNAYELSGRAPLLYNIALCHDRLEHKAEAADFYERFVVEVPDSSTVGMASSRAAILRASLSAPDTDIQDTDIQDTDVQDVRDTQNTNAGSRSLAGPIASFAVGGAGLVTFVVAALISSSRLSDAEGTCNGAGGCNEDELDDVDRASLIADLGLGVAIAGTAVGVVWLLVGGGDEDDSTARFTPVASPSTLGAQVSGSF